MSSVEDVDPVHFNSPDDLSVPLSVSLSALGDALLSYEKKEESFDTIAQHWYKNIFTQLNWTSEQEKYYTSLFNDFTFEAWKCCVEAHNVSLMKKMCKYLAKKDYSTHCTSNLEGLLYPVAEDHRSHVDVITVLIEHSLVKNGVIRGSHVGRQTTLAHYAAKFNISSNNGSNVNASHDWKFVIDYLISRNYSFSGRDWLGKSPIDYICRNDDIKLLNYLLNEKKMSIDSKHTESQNMNLVSNDDDIVNCLCKFAVRADSYSYACFQRLLEFCHLFSDKIPHIIGNSVRYGLNYNKNDLLGCITNSVLSIAARGIDDVMPHFKLAIVQNFSRAKSDTQRAFLARLTETNSEITWQLIDEYSWLLTNIDVKDWSVREQCNLWMKKQEKESKHVIILVQSTFEESRCIACSTNAKEYHHCIECNYTICIKCSQSSTHANSGEKTAVEFTLRICPNRRNNVKIPNKIKTKKTKNKITECWQTFVVVQWEK